MQFFYVLLAFLAFLAVCDLFIGVSNDAVNFLNSAIGSRIARMRTILLVASVGVLLGATFSSGMMTIARSGVMHPQYFAFATVMFVFLAVMVADVLLINAFNVLGLPTSTTVSIIFELLGAATVAAVWTLSEKGGEASSFLSYINTAKALAMISTILISVVVAFVSGAIVQYLARVIFTFHYEGAYRKLGGLLGGFCLTAICYFLVMKGAAGSSFMQPEWIAWIKTHTSAILWTLFAGFTVLFYLLIWCFRVNVFRIIILTGTFALAFAFAGNDLVNFVGVPIAALDSVRYYLAAGATDPSGFLMGDLQRPDQANTWLLLLSGLIMVVTLWTSRKAMRVVETSVKLSSSQGGEHELFGASGPARIIVRGALMVGEGLKHVIPGRIQALLASRFIARELQPGETPLPFDHIRATINLVLSSILIASATSLQLPLSTTYVTFMVAMGSSFADGAWDRETAVYRISGVLAVVSGWFITAFSAFTLAAVMCALLLWGGIPAACVLMLAAAFVLIRSNLRKAADVSAVKTVTSGDCETIRRTLNDAAPIYFSRAVDIYGDMISSFFADDESSLKNLKGQASTMFDALTAQRRRFYDMEKFGRKHSRHLDRDARWCYFRVFSSLRETGRSLQALSISTRDHIANRHRIFEGELKKNLTYLARELQNTARAGDNPHAPLVVAAQEAPRITAAIDRMQEDLLSSIGPQKLSLRGCELYLDYLQFARDLVTRAYASSMLLKELNDRADASLKGLPADPQDPEPPMSTVKGGSAS